MVDNERYHFLPPQHVHWKKKEKVQAVLPEPHGHFGVWQPVAVLRMTLLLSLKQFLTASLHPASFHKNDFSTTTLGEP